MTRAPLSGRAPVRRLALEILLETSRRGDYVDGVLARRLEGLEPRDRHLLQEITFGTVRHQNTLDRVVSFHMKPPVARQREPVRWALRLGAYQIVYLARVPAHAAVNQTVEALKELEGVSRGDVGFVNALLHKVVDDLVRKTAQASQDPHDPCVLPVRSGYTCFSRPVLPLYTIERIDHLSVKYSHPRWLAGRWLDRYGEEEAVRLLEAGNRVPPVTARVTSRAPPLEELEASLRAEGFRAVRTGRERALDLGRGADLSRCSALARGWIFVQDLTSMEIGSVLKPPPGARVLDLCASPGGKAAQLLESTGGEGRLVAADASAEKLEVVERNLSRLGGGFELRLLPRDPEKIDLGETFTHVLVDAPCSNTGVLARRPEARWRATGASIESLVELQSGLLEAALRHLAPGGRLLYATCSIEPEENEERVAALVRAYPDLIELDSRLFLPHRAEADGGFYCLLRKAT